MKKLFTLLAFFSLCIYGHSQNLVWATNIGGPGTDSGRKITLDAGGNIYLTGYFVGTVDFDPGPAIFNMTAHGLFSDVYVTKFDPLGNFVWAKGLGGINDDTGMSVAVDDLGNVYLTGSFHDTADFDPGPGIYNLVALGSPDDIFICKLDSNGDFLWAKGFGNTMFDGGISIAVDAAGNSYTTGYFSLTVDFDPGPGVFNLTVYGTTFDSDVFILKLDPDGNFVWVRRFGGTDSEWAYQIALDANGNIYTAGFFSSPTADFDPGPATYNLTLFGSLDIFISKLDPAGNFVWAKQMGGTLQDNANGMAVDASENVFLTGYFNGTADFDPGPGVFNLTSAGLDEIFIAKLDSSGNLNWVKQIGSTLNDYGNAIALDASANVYITGYFRDVTDFDPGPGTYNLTAAGGSDIFVCKLDSSGNFAWVDGIGGPGYEMGNSIAVDANANSYTIGGFAGTIDFDPGPGVFNLTCNGAGADVFILKLSDNLTGISINNKSPSKELNIYPNPVLKSTAISFSLTQSQNVSLRIFDTCGRTVSTFADNVYEAGEHTIEWNADDVNAGVYFLQFHMEGILQTERLIVLEN